MRYQNVVPLRENRVAHVDSEARTGPPGRKSSEKITKSRVDSLLVPNSGQAFSRDSELKGFAVRVTSAGVKSFILEKRIDGRVKRITIGRYPALTVEQARKEAQKLLGKIATGINPIAEKAAERMRGITLKDAFADFLQARKNLKPRTVYDYRRLMEMAFGTWQKKPLADITKDMVARRHRELGEKSGEAYANLAMRFLRALFNFAIAQYEDGFGNNLVRENPVVRLTQTRAWYRVERRQTVIKPKQLSAWYTAVLALKDNGEAKQCGVVADYLLLLLFTGLRRQEAAKLRWADVDLEHRTLTIPDTKNHQPLTLPLSDFLMELLRKRKRYAAAEYVFPGNGKQGHLIEPRPQMAKVIEASKVPFTLHDLRRTFITSAESLDVSAYALKRLVNHKMSNDVTAGYIVSDVERLRDPMQKITTYLLRCSGMQSTACLGI